MCRWPIKIGLPSHSINSLAEMYHNRWPECLYFILILADSLMDGGAADQAVELLHQASAQDVTGQVPKRIWGEHHPYCGLWPDHLETTVPHDLAVPAPVAAVLGWNRLPSGKETVHYGAEDASHAEAAARPTPAGVGEPLFPGADTRASKLDGLSVESAQNPATELSPNQSPQPAADQPAASAVPHLPRANSASKLPTIRLDLPDLSEGLRPIQAELERVAKNIKKPQLAQADGRFPVYIVFSTRKGLEKQYGPEGAMLVEQAMQNLVSAVRGRREWNSLLYLADTPYASDSALARLNLIPVKSTDPWCLKLALTDLDAALRKQGEMIGAVLIVGGPEIIPFHHLPNPVDDDDRDVPSDNPYASRDENYFVPEWPVGRLPGGSGKDPCLLVGSLHRCAEKHAAAARSKTLPDLLWRWIVEHALPLFTRSRKSLGYTAAIWKRASASVFKPIGEPAFMLISPPVQIAFSSNGHHRR
jgi:hypothetical protein